MTDVAIIGVSLRFPGAESMEGFWRQLIEGRCAIGDLPAGRLETEKMEQGAGTRFRGGFIEDADAFDASFFGITPREAMLMDPQQRFALELAWAAIEDAGYAPSAIKGANAGVFMGVANTDYTELIEKQAANFDPYLPTGTSAALIANRISYWFDLRGPSFTVDAACASSLVAIQQAVRAIEHGDCEFALVGAVNLCWSARRFEILTRNGMLSKDGLCKAFDDKADGYVRAEGGGMLLLKPLARARTDYDAIHAVIRGIGTNHGGRANSLTITSPQAHADLISRVYKHAGISADSVSYIETHGPGTPLGDPIEIHGLKLAFQRMSEEQGSPVPVASCGLGSVKTNLGHLESAAGLAGILKVIASMKHHTKPATLHFERLNQLIQLEDTPFHIVEKTEPWTVPLDVEGLALPRRAGISSFGFGGSNGHVLLEEYLPEVVSKTATSGRADQPLRLIPLSARDGEQLIAMAQNLHAHILTLEAETGAKMEATLRDLSFTLQVGRDPMLHRAIFLVGDLCELREELEAFVAQRKSQRAWQGHVVEDERLTLFLDDDAVQMMQRWVAGKKLLKLAKLWTLGGDVDWVALSAGELAQRTHLPTYPFNRVQYWFTQAAESSPPNHKAIKSSVKVEAPAVPSLEIGSQIVDEQVNQPRETVPSQTESLASSIAEKPRGILLRSLQPAVAGDAALWEPASVRTPSSKMVESLVIAPPQLRLSCDELEQQLVTSLAEALYINPEDVDRKRPFIDLGLDSVIAIEWARSLKGQFGCLISTAHLYDFPNIHALAEKLLGTGADARVFHAEMVGAASTNPLQVDPSPTYDVQSEDFRLETELANSLAQALYIDRNDFTLNRKFIDIGLDSIIAVEWVHTINARYGVALSVSDIYEHPTVWHLARHLAQGLGNCHNQAGLDNVLRQVQEGALDIEKAELLLERLS